MVKSNSMTGMEVVISQYGQLKFRLTSWGLWEKGKVWHPGTLPHTICIRRQWLSGRQVMGQVLSRHMGGREEVGWGMGHVVSYKPQGGVWRSGIVRWCSDQGSTGSNPTAVSMSLCPWARHFTPNCSCGDCPEYWVCKSLWIKASNK